MELVVPTPQDFEFGTRWRRRAGETVLAACSKYLAAMVLDASA